MEGAALCNDARSLRRQAASRSGSGEFRAELASLRGLLVKAMGPFAQCPNGGRPAERMKLSMIASESTGDPGSRLCRCGLAPVYGRDGLRVSAERP